MTKSLILFLSVLFYINCYTQNRIYKSETLIIRKVSNNTFIHTSFLEIPKYGKFPLNGLIFRNNKEAIVFDTPIDNVVSKELIKWITQELKCKIKSIVINHFHNDCLGGLDEFHLNGIKSYANNKTITLSKADNTTVPKIGFDKELILNIGNKKIINTYFGKGHTVDNIVSYIPSENLLFGGCLIKETNARKGNLKDASLEEWSSTVEKIKQKYPQLKTVIPGHGKYGGTELLDYTINLFEPSRPTISFTFDDGSTSNKGSYKFEEWNNLILNHLDDENIKAVFFVKGNGVLNKKGKYLLDSWNERGHKIANHTFSHPNFNRKNISALDFKKELLKTDSLINGYSNFKKLFRFPYLKEGNSKVKIDSIRHILNDYGYKNGYVTIDASDWYIDSRLNKRLKENPKADIETFKQFYLEHIFERSSYYETLSYKLNNRHISHTLLLHHNLAAALFLDDLIDMFKKKGWKVISADKAFNDPIFSNIPNYAGESLIWALAKDSKKYENELRYPAEDSRYEKSKMDKLGL